jgi:cell wall-associated NlpC family hydrolase
MTGARRVVRGRGRRAGARLLVVALVAVVPGTTGRPPVAIARAVPVLAAQTAPLEVVEPGGLTGPDWKPEPPSVQVKELASLSGMHAPPATEPFAVAAAVVADGTGQDALAARLLHAAPGSVRGLVPAPAALKALAFAFAQIGRPYLWGGIGPEAYDCSGLTMQSYRHAGLVIPRTSAEQATVGTPVRLADLIPGDLIFYAHDVHRASTIHHVAMYAGDGILVHAPQTGQLVHLSPVWLDEYIGAIRVAPAVPRTADPGDAASAPPATPSPGQTTSPAPSATTTSPSSPPPTTTSPSETPTGTPTTTDPPPTTTDPPPTTTDPTPTTSDPTPTTTDPTPTPTPTDTVSVSEVPPSDMPTLTASETPTATATPTGP